MKKVTLLLLYFFSVQLASGQKGKSKMFIGFQTGVVAPIGYNDYSLPKYKIGLPSFSYSASIEKRLSINYKLNFSLQYSLSYFHLMQKNLEKNIIKPESKPNTESEKMNNFTSNVNFNTIYKVKKDFGLVGGIGLARPVNFMDKNLKLKNNTFPESNCQYNKYVPALNPFFIIGIENSCNIFRKSLIYSIQYNIGFLPYRNLPVPESKPQSESKYMHGVNIGLKYKY